MDGHEFLGYDSPAAQQFNTAGMTFEQDAHDQQQQQQQQQPSQTVPQPTPDANFYFQMFVQQNQAMTQALNQLAFVQQQLLQLQQAPLASQVHTTAPSAPSLPAFKIPSAQPPAFDGKTYTRPAHEAQATIDEYLHQAENKARFYQLRADNAPLTFTGQLTYVEWIVLGLTGYASEQWRLLPDEERKTKTWHDYKRWIRQTFTSPMTLQQAITTLDNLKQTKSALNYTQDFNRLIAALESKEVKFPTLYLCTKYKKGLKAHLQNNATLFAITTDLAALQQEATRLDTINWELMKSTKDYNGNRRNDNRPTHRPSNQASSTTDSPTAMELDNTERFTKLTDNERETYRRNNWCTFCRKKDHVIDKCERRKQINAQRNGNNGHKNDKSKPRLNNMSTNTTPPTIQQSPAPTPPSTKPSV